MKLTDFSLVFLAIILPIILVVYVNVSFSINAFNEEMYYEKLINTATQDATAAMKEVESLDPDNDYGYSGEFDNRVSINPNIAIDAFYESLYTNLGILHNTGYQDYLDMHIPFLGIIDYNGIYICRLQNLAGNPQKVITPKRYFSYIYMIDNDGNIITETSEIKNDGTIIEGNNGKFVKNNNIQSIHNIEFTLDDRITHNGSYYDGVKWKNYMSKTFFIADGENNLNLFLNEGEKLYVKTGPLDPNIEEMWQKQQNLKENIVKHLKSIRKQIIIDVILKEINYSINSLNKIAISEGISYNFSVPTITTEEMDKYIGNIGIVSFIQGLKVGNRYLKYKGYGSKDLSLTRKYFLTESITGSKINGKLYHKTNKCPEFKVSKYINNTYYKGDAAKNGYRPCPICRP